MDRPMTTLFMLMSVDGKISTGATDNFDFDKDLPGVPFAQDGLHQYYEIEQTTDLWSFNTGRVQAKIGVNAAPIPKKTRVSFVLLDNHHLSQHGVEYFCSKSKEFVLLTTNRDHPAFHVQRANLHIIWQNSLDLPAAFCKLKTDYGCERLTLQSGGTTNTLLLRKQLIDYIDIVVAPVLVGGKDTPTVLDGTNPVTLSDVKALRLIDCKPLQASYLRLRYQAIY